MTKHEPARITGDARCTSLVCLGTFWRGYDMTMTSAMHDLILVSGNRNKIITSS